MKSIAFPNMFTRTKTNMVYDYDATLQNLKMLLWSEKGGDLFGDPYFGAGVKKYLYDQNDVVLQDILIDDIYSAVSTFMPQLRINRKDITVLIDHNKDGSINKGKVVINIKAMNRLDFTTDLYQIVLLETEA